VRAAVKRTGKSAGGGGVVLASRRGKPGEKKHVHDAAIVPDNVPP
jgi:hypothetical protein